MFTLYLGLRNAKILGVLGALLGGWSCVGSNIHRDPRAKPHRGLDYGTLATSGAFGRRGAAAEDGRPGFVRSSVWGQVSQGTEPAGSERASAMAGPGARRRRSSCSSSHRRARAPSAVLVGPAIVLLWLLGLESSAPAAAAAAAAADGDGVGGGGGIEGWDPANSSGPGGVPTLPPQQQQQHLHQRLRTSSGTNSGSSSTTELLLLTGLLALAALLLPRALARACRRLWAAFPSLGRLRGDRPLGGLRYRWPEPLRAPLLLVEEEDEEEAEDDEGEESEDGRAPVEEGLALALWGPRGLEEGSEEGSETDKEKERRLVQEEEAALARVRRQLRRLRQRGEWYTGR